MIIWYIVNLYYWEHYILFPLNMLFFIIIDFIFIVSFIYL